MTCIHVALVLGVVCIPCILLATALGFRIGCGEWPWEQRP